MSACVQKKGSINGTLSAAQIVPYETLTERSTAATNDRSHPDRLSFVKCANPYVKGGHAFGCGQCMPCRLNRRRVWTHRILLEAKDHQHCTFVTLTYDDEHLPGLQSLEPRHLQLFLKSLRFAIEPDKIRYYAVGEYGDQSERPHYHIALFGLPNCARGRTVPRLNRVCCENCNRVGEHWTYGYTYLGELNESTAAYIAGYVTKKLTNADDIRLHGRHPEFARMSNRPGIGALYMDEVASTLMEHGLDGSEDVPAALRHGSKLYPLGRYLRRRLRTRIGRDEKAPQSVLDKAEAELRPLREIAYSYASPGHKQFAFKQEIIEASRGKRARLEGLSRLHKKRATL